MNYDLRPPRRGLFLNLSPDALNRIGRVEYSVFTKAEPTLVWKVFSTVELWPKFFPGYKSIRWQGPPWTVGSRLQIEVEDPISAVVDRALTVCMPPHHVSWISHVRGYTMEQWISIDPFQGGGSRVSIWLEIAGAGLLERKANDLHLLTDLVMTWFDNFSRECDRVVEALRKDDIHSKAD